jgi:hypothetical protein
MSDNEKNEEENGQDEGSINVFDDNAYMFGDDPSGNNLEEQNEINDDNNEEQKDIQNINKEEYDNNDNDEINNMESKDSLRKYLEQQMKHEQIQNTDNNLNINENSIKNKLTTNEENISQKIQNSKSDKNEIKNMNINTTNSKEKNTTKENDDMDIHNNNVNQNEEFEGDEQEQEQEQENYGPGEEEEIENGEEEDMEGEGENEGEEENIPLVTLKFISICQFCKNNFNSTIHLPYLLKCGHFFCLKCIKENFTDEEGIKCPNDGLVALSVKELKLLNNLITDKTLPSQRGTKDIEDNININGINNDEKIETKNSCKIHKGQKLTHIIIDTKQLVCVYCAFDIVRKNPKCEVKEIKEKFDELVIDADKIINLNQNNIKIIQDTLKDIKKNKETEEKNINLYFDHIFKYLNSKKGEYLSQIDSFFTDNAKKLKQKLEIFSDQIEQGESLKALIDNYETNNNFDEIMETYIKLDAIKKREKDNNEISLQEYKFSHDDETKIMKYINNFGDIKTVSKNIHFQSDKKDIFNLKVSSNIAPIVEDQKKNYFNFNTNPMLVNNNNNNKNSSRLTNNSNEKEEMENEINYNNSNISNNNNKKQGSYSNNYNFNFNKINPMSNNSTGKRSIKPNFGNNNNFFRHITNNNNEFNNGNMNYINMDPNVRDNKNYSFNNLSNNNKNRGHRIISIQDNNFMSNKGSSGDGRILNNNIYNMNFQKRIGGDKDNNNLNKNLNNNKNFRNDFGSHTQGSVSTYEYKGFKTFNFK